MDGRFDTLTHRVSGLHSASSEEVYVMGGVTEHPRGVVETFPPFRVDVRVREAGVSVWCVHRPLRLVKRPSTPRPTLLLGGPDTRHLRRKSDLLGSSRPGDLPKTLRLGPNPP